MVNDTIILTIDTVDHGLLLADRTNGRAPK